LTYTYYIGTGDKKLNIFLKLFLILTIKPFQAGLKKSAIALCALNLLVSNSIA